MARTEAIARGATERGRLQTLVANRNTPRKHVFRATIVLPLAEGLTAGALNEGLYCAAFVGGTTIRSRRRSRSNSQRPRSKSPCWQR